jgi:DNA polymerase-1
MKIAMVNTHRALQKILSAQLLLQVHDELIVECDEADAVAVRAMLKREMENAASLSVPLTVEVGIGTSWDKCK